MTGHGSKLGRKLEQAVAALLTARNNEEAAKAVGVSPKTYCDGRNCRNSSALTARPAWRHSGNQPHACSKPLAPQ